MSVINLGPEDAERGVSLRLQDSIRIALDENATTGYVWSVAPACLIDFDLVADERALRADAPGAGAVRRFVLSARRPGRLVLRMVLSRPWETDEAARLEIPIDVAP